MASTGFDSDVLRLNHDNVNFNIQAKTVGAYVLGHRENCVFFVDYVGSAKDLRARLRQHADEKKFDRFKYKIYGSAKEAFEKECTLWHDFGATGELGNQGHPVSSAEDNFKCPVCGQ